MDKVLNVLELVADRGQISLADVARSLSISRPTAHRFLVALAARGYIDHDTADHVYRLGPALRALSARADVSAVTQLAAPALADLRTFTHETINLAAIRQGRIVYTEILDGFHALRMAAHVGQAVPPHATALGKAILSVMSADHRDALLGSSPYARYTLHTITDKGPLEQELAITLARGYSVDREEMDAGVICVAAPIIGSDGMPVAALSVSSVAARFPEAQWGVVGLAIKRWTDKISRRLGAGDVQNSMKGGEA